GCSRRLSQADKKVRRTRLSRIEPPLGSLIPSNETYGEYLRRPRKRDAQLVTIMIIRESAWVIDSDANALQALAFTIVRANLAVRLFSGTVTAHSLIGTGHPTAARQMLTVARQTTVVHGT